MKKSAPSIILLSIALIVVGCYLFSHMLTPSGVSRNDFLAVFWPTLSNAMLTATLIVIAYYTYETYELRKAATAGNELSIRPIIVFIGSEPYFQVENKGAGTAINLCFMIWDKKQFIVTPSQNVYSALPIHSKHQFTPSENMDSTALKKNFPEYIELIEKIATEKHEVIICLYRDIFGNNLYSIANGENSNFRSAFEHGNLGKV